MSRNVILIGLDGSSFELLKPWINNGELPFFKYLLENGVHGVLKSTIPAQTCPALPSLYTGKNPGKIGVFSFVYPNGRLVSSSTLDDLPVWKILNQYGKKCLIVNLRTTYPAEKINGAMICGEIHPESKNILYYPPSLKEMSNDFYQSSTDFYKVHNLIYRGKEEGIIRNYEIVKKRAEIFERILDDIQPDFSIFWISKTDDVHHFSWNHEQNILLFYKKIQDILSHIIKKYSDFNIIIVSDHGVAEMPRYKFSINYWLQKNEFLCRKKSFSNFINLKFGEILIRFLPKSLLKKIFKLRDKRLIKNIKEMDQNGKKVLIDRKNTLIGIDWNKTKIYCETAWGLRINRKIVSYQSNEYMILRNEIISKMKELNINGKKIFKEVWKKEEIYSGKHLDQIPDIIFTLNNRITLSMQEYGFLLKEFKPRVKYGNHTYKRDGIVILIGQDFKKNFKIRPMNIYDIAPLILHLLDIPIPKDFDGKINKEIYDEKSYYYIKDIKYSDKNSIMGSTEKEKMRIRKAVRSLKKLST